MSVKERCRKRRVILLHLYNLHIFGKGNRKFTNIQDDEEGVLSPLIK